MPLPAPSFEIAVNDSDLENKSCIVPLLSASNMAVINSELAIVLPPPLVDDGTPNTAYLESLIPPPLEFQDDQDLPSLEEDEP